jgi:hypothetical protein
MSRELKLLDAAHDVLAEAHCQTDKWGVQRHPDGTGPCYAFHAQDARERCNAAANAGEVTWRHILIEEVYEALAETDPERLREELVQVAAVCVSWIEDLDSREKA